MRVRGLLVQHKPIFIRFFVDFFVRGFHPYNADFGVLLGRGHQPDPD